MLRPTVAFIALRHLKSRRQSRFASFVSVISVLGISLGVAVLIIVTSVMNGFEHEVSKHILGMTSHASILYPGRSMDHWAEAADTIGKSSDVIASAPFVRGGAMISHRGQVHGIVVQGIDFPLEADVSDIGQYVDPISKAALIEPHSRKIILGHQLLSKLQVKPGQKISLIAPRFTIEAGMQAPRYFTFEVAGTLNVGMHEFDSGLALLSITDAQEVFGLGAQVSGLRVKFTDPAIAPQAANAAAAALIPMAASINWTQYHRNFFQALKSQKRIMFIILSIIVAVAAFNIVAAMIMLVREKYRDIAILRTLGMQRRSVMALFIIQGSIVGFIGVFCGVIFGLLGALFAGDFVHQLERWINVQFIKADVYYIDYLPTLIKPGDVIVVASIAAVMSIAATIYPAWRAALTNPADALRYE